jgi:hypothetical protein
MRDVVWCMNMEAWRQMLFRILTIKLGDDEGEVDFCATIA